MKSLGSNLIDLHQKRIYPVLITFDEQGIHQIQEVDELFDHYILPGLIDAHVHIESSLLPPSEFARLAVLHGTIATVSDPHEIANVCGIAGVEWMLQNAATVPFYCFFGAPSCVPATAFETAGAALNADEVASLLLRNEILYLSEMMNFPGVLNQDTEVMQKILSAQTVGKPIDGHAPGLRGDAAKVYASAGISTDHECYTLEEAEEKIELGMKVLIREGSAAKNFDALIPLMERHAPMLMFCSDDKHPDSLLEGHINLLVKRALALGYPLLDVLEVACLNPARHYNLPTGQLRVGDPADFILIDNPVDFTVLQTWIKGQQVSEGRTTLIERSSVNPINQFDCKPLFTEQLASTIKDIEPVIVCHDGQLITGRINLPASEISPANDVLKLVVVNRYHHAAPAIAWIKNFGLQTGAIASSVAHDSHNLIAVGVDDEAICRALNLLIQHKGGLSAVNEKEVYVLPLPIAGLMSDADAFEVAASYTQLDNFAKEGLGSTLGSPFMSLSFMALLVIPHLKLSDLGLFDGDRFSFVA